MLKMKQLLFFLFLSFVSFSQDLDSTSYDSSYRLHHVNNGQNVKDTNVQLIILKEEPFKIIRRPITINDYSLGSNYSSTQNIHPVVATIISVCFLLFITYIVFRVRRSLKADKKKR